jgi:hypothetical protein
VLYSATASCPHQLARAASFYADLSRANVALSRAQEKLILVVSSSLLALTPDSTSHYQQLMLWKSIKRLCEECSSAATARGSSSSTRGGESMSAAVLPRSDTVRNVDRLGSKVMTRMCTGDLPGGCGNARNISLVRAGSGLRGGGGGDVLVAAPVVNAEVAVRKHQVGSGGLYGSSCDPGRSHRLQVFRFN